jgi:hypothetical protein
MGLLLFWPVTGGTDASAAGSTLSVNFSFVAGSMTAAASAGGATLGQVLSFVSGLAVSEAAANGALMDERYTIAHSGEATVEEAGGASQGSHSSSHVSAHIPE